ncbi:hypothetical protein [Undibacterium flavidum]|uniref:AAA domain-containing protein n=1 Tax=Undibacterium flavidum TaxID=2762297 RepID=A0ABR6YBM8_9BURK|nr:hypothetical protein [Undibacterium flavidum]MBC3873968.1 hypothetical protein [Undibacterium flavidum]
MTINSIEIHNVRGIDSLKISKKILKNRPTILIAANGFGKTSIAVAFKCIAHQTSLKLPDEARHGHNALAQAEINLELDDNGVVKTLCVTEVAHSNEIRKTFDIHVIGDMRRIKASARNMGGFSSATAKQIIDPIVICSKPSEADNPYKISSTKQAFGNHANLLHNLDKSLFPLRQFIMRSTEFMEIVTPLIKERRWVKIETIRKKISGHGGSDLEAINNVTVDIQQILVDDDFRRAVDIIVATSEQDEKTAFSSLWQLVFLAKTHLVQLKSYLEYLRYKEIKKSLKAHVADLNTSWKIPAVKEIKGELVVELPDPSHISNGQRDILLLVAMFHVAKHRLTKEKAILIIDEVFDYLDDANLTVAQYYITELIEDYVRQGRSIYPIILTHLNPAFFKNYVFSKQNVIYLDKSEAFDSCDAMKKLIAARNDASVEAQIKHNISKYLVHYHVDDFDFSADLKALNGIRFSWGKFGKFQAFTEEEFNKYKNNQAYDPLAICAITRRTIEKLAYNQIALHGDANDFFDVVKKTSPKLDWASQRGAVVPESHYLLRVIFDDGLHWNLNRDNTIPIVAKLGNPIIKKLIVELVSPHLAMKKEQ